MPIRLRFRAALAACLAVAACGGKTQAPGEPEPEPRMCTLMYVYPGLEIDVAGAVTGAPITVEVTAGGKTVTVEALAGEQGAQCGAGSTNQDMGCAAKNETFEVSLAPAMAADQPAHVRIANVDAPGGPAELTITVRQGALVTTQPLKPAYETTEPNGPGCGEVVKARATLALAAP
jgi:hypothetical protein